MRDKFILSISGKLVHEVLVSGVRNAEPANVPNDMTVVDARYDFVTDCVDLLVKSKILAAETVGGGGDSWVDAPHFTPVYHAVALSE